MYNANTEQLITYSDVIIRPDSRAPANIRSRFRGVSPFMDSIEDAVTFNHNMLPVVSAPMDTVSHLGFLDALYSSYELDSSLALPFIAFPHRFQSFRDQMEYVKKAKYYEDLLAMKAGGLGKHNRYVNVGAVVGLDQLEEAQAFINAGANHILLDVANGYNSYVLENLKALCELTFMEDGPEVFLWGGNVATAEAYCELARYCDFVRVGIGGGSVCSTRQNTGCGYGSLSSILECKKAKDYIQRAGNFAPRIVADGGLAHYGDIPKALAAGADLVMLGRVFASAKESAAPIDPATGLKFYRGMASKSVNISSGRNMNRVSIEGAERTIAVTGTLREVLNQIDGNLRSAMSYVNAINLHEIYEKAELVRVSPSAYSEGLPHAK